MSIWRGDNLLMDEICVQVRQGSIVQIQGTNGSGKTTLYSQLLYLGHKPGITAGLTPFENILALCPELSADDRGSIEAALDELGIADRIDLPSAALSAGQKRRVALCRLRLQAATLWVLDEPLTSLDTNGYNWVRKEIQRHVTDGGAVIFTTHQALSFEAAQVESIVLGEIP